MTVKKKNDKDALIVKSNYMVEACYRLTLIEQKVILYMASMIEQRDEDFKLYTINVSEFIEIIGIEEKSAYNQIRQVTKSLREKSLDIYTPETNTILNVGWLSASKYHIGKGYVELEFSPMLKPYLLQLKSRFTSYNFQNVVRLGSVYSIRLYELLMQYWRLGERTFKIEELRKLLSITGNDYYLYGDFKKRVILMSQKELVKSTDLSFTFKELKTGRKVTGIEFTINVKNPELTEHKKPMTESVRIIASEATTQPLDITAIVNLLPPEHKGKKTILDAITAYYKTHGEDYVAYNIRYTNANCKDKVKYRAYLTKALKENWAIGLAEDIETLKSVKDEELKAIKAKRQKAKQDAERLEKEREHHRMAGEHLSQLSSDELEKLREQAINRLPLDMQEKLRKGDDILETVIRVNMRQIVIETLIEFAKRSRNAPCL